MLSVMKIENTPTITSAALVTVPAVRLDALGDGLLGLMPRSTHSLTRLRMNTW